MDITHLIVQTKEKSIVARDVECRRGPKREDRKHPLGLAIGGHWQERCQKCQTAWLEDRARQKETEMVVGPSNPTALASGWTDVWPISWVIVIGVLMSIGLGPIGKGTLSPQLGLLSLKKCWPGTAAGYLVTRTGDKARQMLY